MSDAMGMGDVQLRRRLTSRMHLGGVLLGTAAAHAAAEGNGLSLHDLLAPFADLKGVNVNVRLASGARTATLTKFRLRLAPPADFERVEPAAANAVRSVLPCPRHAQTKTKTKRNSKQNRAGPRFPLWRRAGCFVGWRLEAVRDRFGGVSDVLRRVLCVAVWLFGCVWLCVWLCCVFSILRGC